MTVHFIFASFISILIDNFWLDHAFQRVFFQPAWMSIITDFVIFTDLGATAAASSLSLGLSLRARNPTGRPAGAARPLPASAARPAGVRPGASGAHGRRAGQNTETKSAERPV